MIKAITIAFHGEFWEVAFRQDYTMEVYAFDINKKEYRFIAEFADKILKEKVKADKEAERDDYMDVDLKNGKIITPLDPERH